MTHAKAVRIGLIFVAIVLILLTLHFGGSWLVETFKEMHGM